MKLVIQSLILFSSLFLFGNEYKSAIDAYEKKDYKKAFIYFTKAAEKEDINAFFKLGVMYEKSKGVSRDMNKSIYFYKKAADLGHCLAQYNLGNIYREGIYVNKDYKRAFSYYKLSSKKNFKWAQYNLARMYLEGMGTKKDYKEAFKIFTALANKGSKNAQYQLANMYYKGYGSKKNYNKAIEFWEKAIKQNCPRAKKKLREFYIKHKNFYRTEQVFLKKLNLLNKNKIVLKPLFTEYKNIINLFSSRLFMDEIHNENISVSNWLKFIDKSLIYLEANNTNLNKSVYEKHLLNAKYLMLNSNTMLDYLISLSAYKKLYSSEIVNFKDLKNILKEYSPLPKTIFFKKLDDEEYQLMDSVQVLGDKFLKKNKLTSQMYAEGINTIISAAKDYSEKYFTRIKKAISYNSLKIILEIENSLANDKKDFLKNKNDINESVGKLFVIMLIKPISYYKAYDVHNTILKLYNSLQKENIIKNDKITDVNQTKPL